MKRLLIPTCLVLSILFSMFYPVSAAEEIQPDFDADRRLISSQNVDPSIYQALNVQEDEQVFRVYWMDITAAFGRKKTIAQVLEQNQFAGVRYTVISPHADTRTYYYQDGEWKSYGLHGSSEMFAAYQDASILKRIASNIEVENVYFLAASTYGLDYAIYYETNLGNYVYYAQKGLKPCLFSLDAFHRFQYARHQVSTDSYVDPALWDLSAFDFTSADFDPNAPVRTFAEIQEEKVAEQAARQELLLYCGLGAVMILFAGAAFLFFRKKKAA